MGDGQRPNRWSTLWLNCCAESVVLSFAESLLKSYSNGSFKKWRMPKRPPMASSVNSAVTVPLRRASRRPSAEKPMGGRCTRESCPGRRSSSTSSAGSAVKVAAQQASEPTAPITPNW